MIYEQVFNTIPTNEIRKFSDVASYVERPRLKTLDPYLVCSTFFQIESNLKTRIKQIFFYSSQGS